jgi:hypothetical protein
MSSDAITRAITTVPFYARQGLGTGLAAGAPLEEWLRHLPLLTRAKIRPTLPKVWFPEGRDAKAELASGAISIVEVGSAASRVRVLFDAKAWREQERRALTLHPQAAKALAGSYSDAVLWVPERGTGSCGSGDPAYEERVEGTRLHLNSRQDPTFWTEPVMTRMLDELALHGTTALLADPFYLDVLARHAATLGRKLDVQGFIATTRARKTLAQCEALARVFSGPVIDVLAAREVGTLFVEGTDGSMHHAPGTHVELLRAKVETPGSKNVALVVVTTLEREVQPLLRYVLGDLVQMEGDRVVSFEGSIDEAIVRPDGALVTAGAIDRAVGSGTRAYQVIEQGGAIEVDAVGDVPDLASLFAGMRLTARSVTAIGVEPNGKYRTVRRTIGESPLSALFESCEGA